MCVEREREHALSTPVNSPLLNGSNLYTSNMVINGLINTNPLFSPSLLLLHLVGSKQRHTHPQQTILFPSQPHTHLLHLFNPGPPPLPLPLPILMSHVYLFTWLALRTRKRGRTMKSFRISPRTIGSDSDGSDHVHDQRMVILTKQIAIAESFEKKGRSR